MALACAQDTASGPHCCKRLENMLDKSLATGAWRGGPVLLPWVAIQETTSNDETGVAMSNPASRFSAPA